MAGPAPGAVPAQDGLDRFGLIGDAACGPRHSPSCIADVSAAARSQGVKAAVGSAHATRQFASASHRRTLPTGARSEEHTSELQSQMRNSYAVFCLKKKKTS